MNHNVPARETPSAGDRAAEYVIGDAAPTAVPGDGGIDAIPVRSGEPPR